MKELTYEEMIGQGITFIDTRAPVEFEEDHIPGAINIPILDNEERALVGTMYARDKDAAVDKGYQIYKEKTESLKEDLGRIKGKLCIYCFRGGLRSETIVKLARESGIDAVKLKNGYKAYREYVRGKLSEFVFKPKLIVIYGLTGTGKTELLQEFQDRIDLEGLAQHRSSVYGAVGQKPRSQKCFESLLLHELMRLNDRKYVVTEGESRKIGKVMIPGFFFEAMRTGIKVKLIASRDERIKRLVSIYAGKPELIPELRDSTLSIEKKLGKKITAELLTRLDHGENERFMEILIDKYYDPLYGHTMDSMEFNIHGNKEELKKEMNNIIS
jgi:tRNA 2-selenouridine synthase